MGRVQGILGKGRWSTERSVLHRTNGALEYFSKYISSSSAFVSSRPSLEPSTNRLLLEQLKSKQLRSSWPTRKRSFMFASSESSMDKENYGYKLVIVESPSKSKTIAKILNDYAKKSSLGYKFRVDSCMGHVRNLPSTKKAINPSTTSLTGDELKPYTDRVLGLNIQDDYKPLYIINEQKIDVVKRLQDLSWDKECIEILLATDNDREGEAIAWHLLDLLASGEQQNQMMNKMRRVTFNEITKKAIETAVFNDSEERSFTESTVALPEDVINMDLAQAQETRRILDRLAGYTMSPLLWKKIAPGLSAGRVQSVGMWLIVNREKERLRFQESTYMDMTATLSSDSTDSQSCFNATMIALNGKRLATGRDFDYETGELKFTSDVCHLCHELATEVLEILSDKVSYQITSIESKERSFSPPQPFKTSTLQQESNTGLGLSVSETMSCAQSLYEAGYISYMRTDSTSLSDDAIKVGQNLVHSDFGPEYTSTNSNYGKKQQSKDAKTKKNQKKSSEAHEAIRPAIQDNTFISPSTLSSHFKERNPDRSLSPSAFKLYELIYKRTVASFMANQIVNQTTVLIDGISADESTTASFRSSGSVTVFPGFSTVWGRKSNSGSQKDDGDKMSKTLPSNLFSGMDLHCELLTPIEHKTKPKARFTEASFVKELESLGVGRPSTYQSVVQTLRDRAYVGSPGNERRGQGHSKRKSITGPRISAMRAAGSENLFTSKKGPLVPSLSAFVVSSFLEKNCPSYVDPQFTSVMEARLDKIAKGDTNNKDGRLSYLNEYYGGEKGLASQVERIDATVSSDEARKADLNFLETKKGDCKSTDDSEGNIGLFIGPWGPFIKRVQTEENDKSPTAALPPDLATDISLITPSILKTLLDAKKDDGILVGKHPDDGREIRFKIGRYGPYLSVVTRVDGEDKISNHALPKEFSRFQNGIDIDITLEEAVGYVNLPRTICHIEDEPVVAGVSTVGQYLKFNGTYVTVNTAEDNILHINPERARSLVIERVQKEKSRLPRGTLADLGEMEGSKVLVRDGRFGVYLNWKSGSKQVNAKIPPEFYLDGQVSISLEDAWKLIEEKRPKMKKRKQSKGKRKQEESSVNTSPPPKRPPSAYILFCAENRAEVSKDKLTLGEVSKELAKRWKQTSEIDREPFFDLAAKAKRQYETDFATWKKENSLESTQKTKGGRKYKVKKKQSGSTKSKRSPTAYQLFCAEKRPEIKLTYTTFGEVSKELARQWNDIKDKEERKHYEDLAKAQKESQEV